MSVRSDFDYRNDPDYVTDDDETLPDSNDTTRLMPKKRLPTSSATFSRTLPNTHRFSGVIEKPRRRQFDNRHHADCITDSATNVIEQSKRSEQFYFWTTILIVAGALLFSVCLLFLLFVANSEESPVFPNFQIQINACFMGLAQCVLFGWLYGAVVSVWTRHSVDFVDAFAADGPFEIPDDTVTVKGRVMQVLRYVSIRPFYGKLKSAMTTHDSRRVFFLSALLSFVLFITVFGYVAYGMFPNSLFPHTPDNVERSFVYPGSIFALTAVVVFLAFLLIPRVPPYASTRIALARLFLECLLTPFLGFGLVHNVVTDSFTSASLTFAQLYFGACFFVSGNFLSRSTHVPRDVDRCGRTTLHYAIMTPVMYALPFWLRFVQCLYRAWINRGFNSWRRTEHILNAGKYFSCIVVIATSALHLYYNDDDLNAWTLGKFSWVVSLFVKTTYVYIWDISLDWGLLCAQPDVRKVSSHVINEYDYDVQAAQHYHAFPWRLRPRRVFPTSVYYVAMFVNFWARLSWGLALSVSYTFIPRALNPLLAIIEILRRMQWMIFRVENAYLIILDDEERARGEGVR